MNTVQRRTVAVVLVGVSLMNASCAFLFTKGPPPQHAQMTYFQCHESSRAIDGDIAYVVVTLPTIVGPVVFGLSALEGAKRTRQCRNAKWAANDEWTKFKATLSQRPDTAKPPPAQSR
jgi:hypothetical protein